MTNLQVKLRELILVEHSKAQRDKVLDWIGDDSKRFDLLMKLFLEDEYRVVQRAAWVLRFIGQSHPEWIQKYTGKLVKAIEQPIHDAVVRNGLLVLLELDIPKKYWGLLLEIGFGYLTKVDTPTAIKRAALLVVAKICEQEPELREELVLVLQDQLPHAPVGFRSIARKYIKKWQT